MAPVLHRSSSTISQKLQRNSTSKGWHGRTFVQRACSYRRAQARAVRKLHIYSILLGVVEHFLCLRWTASSRKSG